MRRDGQTRYDIQAALRQKEREKENMKKKVFTPALFDCLKHYSGRQFTKDLVSDVIVAIIALPLSIALAAQSTGEQAG